MHRKQKREEGSAFGQHAASHQLFGVALIATAATLFFWLHLAGLLCGVLFAIGVFWFVIPGHVFIYGPHLWLLATFAFVCAPFSRRRDNDPPNVA